jgi:hypothetical protein
VDGFDWSPTLKKINKILLSSLIMGIFTWVTVKLSDLFIFDTSRVIFVAILFTISSLFGAFVYFLSAKLLNIEEFYDYQKYFFKFKRFVFRK